MLTIAKLNIYQKFNGDAAAWARETGGADSSGMSERDWPLIENLRSGVSRVVTGCLTPEDSETVQRAFLAATADEQTRQAFLELATSGSFLHPILGTITPSLNHKYWCTQPLAFEGLGLKGRICTFTRGEPPSEAQLSAMVAALGATPDMKMEMARRMLVVFEDLHSVSEDLPELRQPDEVWPFFSEMLVDADVNPDGDNETGFSFRLAFDIQHEVIVNYKNGQFEGVELGG